MSVQLPDLTTQIKAATVSGSRLRVLRAAAGKEEFRSSDLSRVVGLDESTVRKHLAGLLDARLLDSPSPRLYSITRQGERVLVFVEASLADQQSSILLREGLRLVTIDVDDGDYSAIEAEVLSTSDTLFESDGDFDLVAVLRGRAAEAKRLSSLVREMGGHPLTGRISSSVHR